MAEPLRGSGGRRRRGHGGGAGAGLRRARRGARGARGARANRVPQSPRSPRSALGAPFLGEGSRIVTSLLEDLVTFIFVMCWCTN